jgi:hypothetical protein
MAKKAKAKKLDLASLETTLEDVFVGKAPALPKNIKEVIVTYGPWVILISLIASIPSLLALLGLGTVTMPFGYWGGMRYARHFGTSTIFLFAITLLNAIALPGLFKRQKQAWKLLFYSSLVAFIQNLLSLNLGSLVIGSALSWYILFQIKSSFNK